jgi:hypothetical protein
MRAVVYEKKYSDADYSLHLLSTFATVRMLRLLLWVRRWCLGRHQFTTSGATPQISTGSGTLFLRRHHDQLEAHVQ